jgi:twitching motility protein PilT
MEQIEQLLSRFKDYQATELHLTAGQPPYYLADGAALQISTMPIQHKDVVQLVSPILPPTAKTELMERPSTEFLHRSPFGNFMVTVKKAPQGFSVVIRGQGANGAGTPIQAGAPAGFTPPPPPTRPTPPPTPPPGFAPGAGGSPIPPPMPPPPMVSNPIPTPIINPPLMPPASSGSLSNVVAPSNATVAPPTPAVSLPPRGAMKAEIDNFFFRMSQMGASDLHISVGVPPMVRHDGEMKSLEGTATLRPEDTNRLLQEIMPQRNREEFDRRHDTDFAYEIDGLGRFRSNIFMDRKGMGAVFRIIPTKILTAEQLKLAKPILDLCFLNKGLVVVTGPTGSGKSTTLAAMVDHMNRNRHDHIITIEDPIEFVHDNKGCLINQREVHNHTDSFKDALRAALREDPDIILVGEMRDLETIAIAIETAETGHLVFGTLHTTTAASTIDRIIDQFPADRQAQIRTMLSESLKGVIAQTLLKKKGGGRVAALEVLLVNSAISNLIREGKTFQIPSIMQTSKNLGMTMLNEALFEHVRNDLVTPEDAYVKAVDKVGFKELCKRNNVPLSF